ncbi:MAG: hypothetical protein JWL79_3089 [Frankiales bacterium]|nr:hypothetical protein [Frankiales bacterium]
MGVTGEDKTTGQDVDDVGSDVQTTGKDELGVFQPGHTYSLRFGYASQRAITPLADLIAGLAMQEAPVLRAFPFLVDLFAQEFAIVLLLRKTLDTIGVTDHNHEPRESHLRRLASHTTQVMKMLREMGLTRKVAAELQLDIAQAAQAAMATAKSAANVPEPMQAFIAERGFGVEADGVAS